jgi:hypothetical protein
MNRGTLTLSIGFLLVALVGGLLFTADLWFKNAPESVSTTDASPPTIDGMIMKGEYAHTLHDETTGMDLSWSVVGDKIYFGLHSPGQGWLALGLAPDGPAMKGADIFIGYIKDGQAIMQDEFADTPYSHKPDTDAGGSSDIISFAGSQDESGTTLEFERLLVTGDAHDKPIVQGKMFVILAYSDKADFTSYHGKHRNTVQVDFFAPEGSGS